MRRLLGPLAVAVLGLAAGDLHTAAASPPSGALATPGSSLTLTAHPVFGQDATTGGGWSEVIAGLENSGTAPLKGTVELQDETYASRPAMARVTRTRVSFHVPPGQRASVHLPTPMLAPYSPMHLVALSESGAVLAESSIRAGDTTNPMLVDVHQPSRLTVVMREWPLALTWDPSGSYSSSSRSATLAVGVPSFDRVTGDPVLPETAAAYAGATVVLVASDALARLQGPALDALVSWVYAGGTLAVVPARPEDLRAGPLATLAGGAIAAAPPNPALLMLPAIKRPLAPGEATDEKEPPEQPGAEPPDDAGGPEATPIAFRPASTTAPAPIVTGPGPALREKLRGYTGGDLKPSPFGASARRGLGEVHVLAFDPSVQPAVDDGWTHARIVEMVTRAWGRHAVGVYAPGGGERSGQGQQSVRRLLDPNEAFRPSLALAALLLVLYSIVAGPIVFLRAARKGRPLDPLLWAPACAVVAFGLIVLIGFAGKGWRGRARRLALAEVGAGETRANVQRYRGFFSSRTRTLTVPASDSGAVLEVLDENPRDRRRGNVRVERDGVSLENIPALPWQTVVVSESATLTLKGGISVLDAGGGAIDVVNHTGRSLKDVLVAVPKGDVAYFPALKDGEKIRASAGRVVLTASARSGHHAGAVMVHALSAVSIAIAIDARKGDGIMEGWRAFEETAGMTVDWLPDDAPVVMGEVEGGENVTSDAGFSVEKDRLLLRVVGFGGTP